MLSNFSWVGDHIARIRHGRQCVRSDLYTDARNGWLQQIEYLLYDDQVVDFSGASFGNNIKLYQIDL